MQKKKITYKCKVLKDGDGWWRVISGYNSNVVSGKMHTQKQALQYIKANFEQMQQQFGNGYEVILEQVPVANYTYDIDYEKIDPIAKEYHYAAKVVYLEKIIENKREKLPAPFGEVWGRTAEEAKAKIDKLMKGWIDQQFI